MEWYFTEICRPNPTGASVFGVIQLIAMAAVYIFRLGLSRPSKKE